MESKERVIVLPSVTNVDAFLCLLDCIYAGTTERLKADNFFEAVQLADQFLCPALTQYCQRHVYSLLEPSNWLAFARTMCALALENQIGVALREYAKAFAKSIFQAMYPDDADDADTKPHRRVQRLARELVENREPYSLVEFCVLYLVWPLFGNMSLTVMYQSQWVLENIVPHTIDMTLMITRADLQEAVNDHQQALQQHSVLREVTKDPTWNKMSCDIRPAIGVSLLRKDIEAKNDDVALWIYNDSPECACLSLAMTSNFYIDGGTPRLVDGDGGSPKRSIPIGSMKYILDSLKQDGFTGLECHVKMYRYYAPELIMRVLLRHFDELPRASLNLFDEADWLALMESNFLAVKSETNLLETFCQSSMLLPYNNPVEQSIVNVLAKIRWLFVPPDDFVQFLCDKRLGLSLASRQQLLHQVTKAIPTTSMLIPRTSFRPSLPTFKPCDYSLPGPPSSSSDDDENQKSNAKRKRGEEDANTSSKRQRL